MQERLRKLLSGLKSFHNARQEKFVRARLEQVKKIEFFHSAYFGGEAHHCPAWKTSDKMFHSDAPVAVVVTRNGRVSGVIGFEIVGSTILVRQLQGAPRGHFHDGTTAEEYLLWCAEQIARALRMKTLRVVDAKTAIEYRKAAPETDRPFEEAERHMRKIYSFPAQAGYAVKWFWRLRRPTYYRTLS